MTRLFRIPILPRSPWRTLWQADTLAGALLAVCARVHGADVLRRKLIHPMLAGQPPFVLSDALPGDLLPFPIHFRLHRHHPNVDSKFIKRARWISFDDFLAARAGVMPKLDALLSDHDVFDEDTRHHNTLSRLTDTSSPADGNEDEDSAIGLFQKSDIFLKSAARQNHLTLYFRCFDPGAADLLLDLLYELSLTGFGADTSTGRGQFDLPEDPRPVPDLDSSPPHANGLLSLSTFQPGPNDPTEGYWDAFPKFPKAGPDLALADHHIHKNTLILFRPGAVFRTDPARPFLGHAIDTRALFPSQVVHELLARDRRVIHPAFGLTIPIHEPSET